MKKIIATMLFTTAICGMMAAQPAHANLFSRHASSVTTTRSVTETKLSRNDIIAIQSSLSSKGFYRGSVDGRWGPMTSSALSSFQSAQGLSVNGLPTSETLAMLGVSANNVATYDSRPETIEPAAGGVTVETTTSDTDAYRTRAGGGFVSINTNHVNGSTCLLCTNGVIGNGGTPSMRSNEY